MYRLIDHKQNILRPKGDQSFHTVWAQSRPSALTRFCPCDLKSYEALFTAIRVNHLYHQMTLWL